MDVLAYYFPNWHADPVNARRHGPGWTEWELVRAARPRYPGHRQPLVPAWGEFDESDPAWMARQVALAADHGVTGFLFDWYWQEGGPFLSGALNRGFLAASNRGLLTFSLMWANHDWIDLFPAPAGGRSRLFAPGAVDREEFDRIAAHLVDRYFTRPEYLRIGGRPFFSIYELGTLVAGLGGMDAAAAALDGLRARARAAGLPGIHLNAVAWGLNQAANLPEGGGAAAICRRLGVDSVGAYCWVHDADPGDTGFPRGSYEAAFTRIRTRWAEERARLPVPYQPNVSMGWDPSPRTPGSAPFTARGYPWTAVLEGNTPTAFRAALVAARDFAAASPDPAGRIVTLNAWNEWTEGSFLLPEAATGTAYLEAVRGVFRA